MAGELLKLPHGPSRPTSHRSTYRQGHSDTFLPQGNTTRDGAGRLILSRVRGGASLEGSPRVSCEKRDHVYRTQAAVLIAVGPCRSKELRGYLSRPTTAEPEYFGEDAPSHHSADGPSTHPLMSSSWATLIQGPARANDVASQHSTQCEFGMHEHVVALHGLGCETARETTPRHFGQSMPPCIESTRNGMQSSRRRPM